MTQITTPHAFAAAHTRLDNHHLSEWFALLDKHPTLTGDDQLAIDLAEKQSERHRQLNDRLGYGLRMINGKVMYVPVRAQRVKH